MSGRSLYISADWTLLTTTIDCNSTAVQSRYNYSTSYVTTGLLRCDLSEQTGQQACGLRVSGPCYVTVHLMTFNRQSNARRTPVESKSYRSCNRRIT